MMKLFYMVVAVLISAATTQAAPLQKISGDYVEGEFIVVPKQGGILAAASSGYQVHAQKQAGGMPFLVMKTKPGQDTLSAMQALAAQPWVASVEPNYIYKASVVATDPKFNLYWGLQNTGQNVNGVAGSAGADMSVTAAWDINTNCAGITVAVIDTGVDYNHPDLTANMWVNVIEAAGTAGVDDDGNGFVDDVRGWDFVQDDNDPMDYNIHGTHVAGTIGAAGNNGIGGTGVCQTATIMPLRVLDTLGSGTTLNIIAAIDYAVANGAKIINMSLGGAGFSTPMSTAITNANLAGVLVVVAAGNENTNNDLIPSYPASYNQTNIITVAATTQTDGLATFSNYGLTHVDVGAPGTNIQSTVPPARKSVLGCSWNFDTVASRNWAASTWDITTPATPVSVASTIAYTAEKAFSPFYSITDTPGALYANNRSYRATSPACDLTGSQGTLFEYQLELDTERSFDFVNIDTYTSGQGWVNKSGLSGTTNGSFLPFETDVQNLDGYAAVYVRFSLETDGSGTFGGFHADDVKITAAQTTLAAHVGTEYAFLDGTSMATPNTAGVAALVWAADPTLTNIQLKDRLLNNGDPVAALAGKTVTGKRINALMSMPLTVPTGLATQVATAYTVPMTWVDNAINETAYEIQRKTGAGFFARVATVPANTVSFTDATGLPGTTYTYQVLAQGRDGRLSIPSVIATATTTANNAPTSATINPITTQEGVVSALAAVTVVDPDVGDLHTISIAVQATNGVAAVNGSSIAYTPNVGFVGTDSFTFKATDKGGLFVTGTASVTVTAKPIVPAPKPSGGGCVMGASQSFDPLFAMIIAFAGMLLYRRKNNI